MLLTNLLSRSIILVMGRVRRILLVSFHRSMVKTSIRDREGDCRQCGSCCRLVFNCPLLGKNNQCTIYTARLRPSVCRKFPLDQRDIEDVMISSGNTCGYQFSPVCPHPAGHIGERIMRKKEAVVPPIPGDRGE